MRFKAKLLNKREIYMPYAMRCQYAIETMTSVKAPEDEQIIELELMLLEDSDEMDAI